VIRKLIEATARPDSREQANARIALLERRIAREVKARQAAEDLLEAKSLELYHANQSLRGANCNLERRVAERTAQLTAARDQALSANKAKSDFLAGMSHELRTPLNAIIGFSEVMKIEVLGPVTNPLYREYIANINDSGQHLLGLINDMLDVAKIEAGRMELYEETFDLGTVVAEVIRLLGAQAEQGALSIGTELQPELPRIRGDKGKVRQILLNLLSNAIKFTPRAGTVTIAAGLSASGSFVFSVADTGFGIPAKQLDAVLEAFVQVQNVMTRSHGGSGLGLPLCKALAELHGGFMALESEVGQGTRVTISLPKWRVIRPLEAG
jgi:two-component system cell cycle sensor histidine kinase PleC